MSLNRRQFIQLVGLGGGALAVSGCAPIVSRLAGGPVKLATWPGWDGSPDFAYLSRLTYGPTAYERQRTAEIGLAGWIEEQLDFSAIDDGAAEVRLRPHDMINRRADALAVWDQEDVIEPFKQATLLRRVYSRRQLYETMVEFWTDHFNIALAKGECWYLKVVDDRQVIRPHAFGRFDELLFASAKSPAMLVYLDNQVNHKDHPNENYAREVMELHTLGVDGGYTQDDVMELARALTGWSVKENWRHGDYVFDEEAHDNERKVFLGEPLSAKDQAEAEEALSRLVEHPSTAAFIAEKLVRRFITDDPHRDAPELVAKTAAAFQQSRGDIQQVLRVVLLDGLLNTPLPLPLKIKRPIQFVTSTLRQLQAESNGSMAIHNELALMGHSDYDWPTPDGPPDEADAWLRNLMPRWRFALQLLQNDYGGTRVEMPADLLPDEASAADWLDHFSDLLLGGPLDPGTQLQMLAVLPNQNEVTDETRRLLAAGLLASPAFQWR